MNLSEKFLPNEKLINEYTEIKINQKSNSSLFITNFRLFIIQNSNHFWDLKCENIDHLERTFIHRFSWWWQLILIPISLLALVNGNIIFFGLASLLLMARQYIKVETLIIHSKAGKWSLNDNNKILDEIPQISK